MEVSHISGKTHAGLKLLKVAKDDLELLIACLHFSSAEVKSPCPKGRFLMLEAMGCLFSVLGILHVYVCTWGPVPEVRRRHQTPWTFELKEVVTCHVGPEPKQVLLTLEPLLQRGAALFAVWESPEDRLMK